MMNKSLKPISKIYGTGNFSASNIEYPDSECLPEAAINVKFVIHGIYDKIPRSM